MIPSYRRIADEIAVRIKTGELRPGDRLPSTRQIARDFGVAMATATKVLTALQQQGLAVARPGVGTVVAIAPGAGPNGPARPPSGPGRPSSGRRSAGPRPAEQELTREAVVQVAMSIADEEGLAELSMRRIASTLGVATMSLYRHVHGKDELVLLMIDAAIGQERFPSTPPEGWRARLEVSAHLQWRSSRRHPWLAPVMSITRPQLAPNALLHTEWNLRAFDGTGLSFADRMYVNILLFAYVRGVASALEAETQAERDTGLTSEEWVEGQDRTLRSMLTSGALGAFWRLVSEGGFDFDLDTLFAFGLERLLDGLEVFVTAAGRPGGPRPEAAG